MPKRKTYLRVRFNRLPFPNYNGKNKSFFGKLLTTTLDFGPSKPIVATVTALTSSVPPRSFSNHALKRLIDLPNGRF
jgi:hypothetical protein